jgi:hypothetical protein
MEVQGFLLLTKIIVMIINNFIVSVLFYIILILASCSSKDRGKEVSEDQKLANYFANHFDSISKSNYIQYGHIVVDIDTTYNMKKPIIFYDPLIYPYENFVKEYTLYLIRSIDSSILNKIDSVIFEIQPQDTTFGLKRYRGSKQEAYNLKDEYRTYGKDFDDLIEYVIKNKYVDGIEFLDYFMKKSNEDSYNNSFEWMNEGFMNYSKKFYSFKQLKDTTQLKLDKLILNKFLYIAPMWYQRDAPLKILNFVRNQLDMDKIFFTLDDTLKYGTKPKWLIEMYSTTPTRKTN